MATFAARNSRNFVSLTHPGWFFIMSVILAWRGQEGTR